MTVAEIKETQAEFENSVKLAHTAGFDGISIHGAYGYLVDAFLRSHSNQRKDDYGGCAANRIRYTLELIDIALKHWEPYQVTIKLSPTSRIKDMFDSNPLETYSLLLQELSKRNIGSVEIA
jgi:N-ethylmaleimide reductase